MIVSINQPAYLPWLGYFDRIARSDLHIVLDNVQLERNTKTSFTNRNRVKTPQGTVWLTVPVKKSAPSESLIDMIEIDGTKWCEKHYRTLSQCYARAPFFEPHRNWFQDFFAAPSDRLAPLLRVSTEYLLGVLGIQTKILYASEIDVSGSKSQLVLNLCRAVNATTYLSGPLGRGYLNEAVFKQAGIDVVYHDYAHPLYTQLHGDFSPFMSVVDLLFNCGGESWKILNSNGSH